MTLCSRRRDTREQHCDADSKEDGREDIEDFAEEPVVKPNGDFVQGFEESTVVDGPAEVVSDGDEGHAGIDSEHCLDELVSSMLDWRRLRGLWAYKCD